MKIFLFEWKKLFKKRSVWMAAALSAAVIVALYFFSVYKAESIRSVNSLRSEQYQNMFAAAAEESRTEKARAVRAGDTDTAQAAEQAIEHAEKSQARYAQWRKDYQNGFYEKVYKKDIEDLELGISAYGSMGIEDQLINNFTLRVTKAEKEWLMKRKLEPLVQQTLYISYLPTIYDTFTGRAEQEWRKTSTRYAETGVGYTYIMMPKFYLPLLALIACFVFANGFSSQINRKERGLHFALTQPVRKAAVFAAAYGSALLSAVGFFLLLTAMPFLLSLFTKGMGSFQFPVLLYEGGTENPFDSKYNALDPEKDLFHFIPFETYFLKALILGILLTLVLLGVYTLYSLLVRSPLVTMILTGSTAAVAWKLFNTTPYNPFTYLDIHGILNGAIAAEAFNPSFSFRTGILVLTCTFLLLLMGAYAVFQWRSRRVA